MSRAVTPRAPWPVPPVQGAEVAERLAWYAAVARWAPSKHNSQPWRFVVRGSSLELWTDPERSLPQSDPDRREMVLSCGAALHLVTLAAHALGVQVVATVLPDGDGDLLARVVEVGRLLPTSDDLALLELVPHRRTDRGPLDGESLDADISFLLQSEAAGQGATLRLVMTPGDRAPRWPGWSSTPTACSYGGERSTTSWPAGCRAR